MTQLSDLALNVKTGRVGGRASSAVVNCCNGGMREQNSNEGAERGSVCAGEIETEGERVNRVEPKGVCEKREVDESVRELLGPPTTIIL